MKNSMHLINFKKTTAVFLLMICLMSGLYAQQNGVSINATGAAADNSAGLDISYADKGVLIPRVSLVQTTLPNPVSAPAVSLLVFNSATINDVTPGYYYWDGVAWARLSSGGGGGTGSIGCSTTSNNNLTLRGDGLGGWECTSTVRVTGNSSTGSVGINTTPNSSYDLRVNNNVGIGFSPNSSYELSVDGDGHFTDRVGIATTPNTSYTLRVNGNAGIGSSPSSSFTLSVGGDAHVSDGISVGTTSSASSGQVYANNSFRLGSSSTGTGTAVVRTSGGLLVPQSSTIRVKENIKDLSIDKENFLKLRPVSFNLKKSLGGDPDIGFIAEEVAQLVPDLVVYGPKRTWIGHTGEVLKNEKGEEVLSSTEVEPYSVRYDKIGVYLVQIVAEQQATIKSQQAQIDALINRMEKLEAGKMAQAKSSDKAVTAGK